MIRLEATRPLLTLLSDHCEVRLEWYGKLLVLLYDLCFGRLSFVCDYVYRYLGGFELELSFFLSLSFIKRRLTAESESTHAFLELSWILEHTNFKILRHRIVDVNLKTRRLNYVYSRSKFNHYS